MGPVRNGRCCVGHQHVAGGWAYHGTIMHVKRAKRPLLNFAHYNNRNATNWIRTVPTIRITPGHKSFLCYQWNMYSRAFMSHDDIRSRIASQRRAATHLFCLVPRFFTGRMRSHVGLTSC